MKGPQPQNSAVETYFHQPSRSAVLPFHQTKSFRFCFIGNESDACHRGSRHLKPFALSCGKGSVDKASADFSTATSLLKGQGKRERPNRPTNLDFREAQGLCTFDPSHAKAPVSAYLDLPTWTSERRRASVNSTLRTPRRQGAPTSTYWGGPLWRPWNPLHFWRLVLGPSMDKIFARVVIRLAASHCS